MGSKRFRQPYRRIDGPAVQSVYRFSAEIGTRTPDKSASAWARGEVWLSANQKDINPALGWGLFCIPKYMLSWGFNLWIDNGPSGALSNSLLKPPRYRVAPNHPRVTPN